MDNLLIRYPHLKVIAHITEFKSISDDSQSDTTNAYISPASLEINTECINQSPCFSKKAKLPEGKCSYGTSC